MNCSTIRADLMNWLEGSLPPERSREIEKHLEVCEGCSGAAENIRSFMQYYSNRKDDTPAPFATTRILQRIESELARNTIGDNRRFISIMKPVTLALMFVIAVFAGFFVGKQGREKLSEQQQQKEIQEIQSDLRVTEITADENLFRTDK